MLIIQQSSILILLCFLSFFLIYRARKKRKYILTIFLYFLAFFFIGWLVYLNSSLFPFYNQLSSFYYLSRKTPMYLLTIIILILGIADFLTKQQAISFSKEEKSSNLMRIGIHYKIVSLLLFFALHGIDLVINENFLKAIGVSFVSSEIGSIGIISTIYFLGIINYELVSIKENYKQMGIDANYLNPIIGLFKIFNTRIINKIKGKQEKKEK